MKKNMKKTQETIHILPQCDRNASIQEFHANYMKNWELAKTLDYVPTSLEELKRIDYMDYKVVMNQNNRFFIAVVALCGDYVSHMIEAAKELVRTGEVECESLDEVQTLNDLLNSNFFGEDHDNDNDSNRGEFINWLADYIYH